MTGDDLDADAPIPYRLTSLGHREVQAWRAEQTFAGCAHRWRARGRYLECDVCGDERELRRGGGGSIPAYLGSKRA